MSDPQGRSRASGDAGKPMIGIYDFSYGPYALGDALTWTMNLNVGAAAAGCDAIDQYLVIDRSRPGNRHQLFITQYNYVRIIDNLFPAFLCSPMLRSLKLFHNPPGLNLFLLREVMRRRPMWPSFYSHLNKKLDFNSHRRINAFYRERGYLPWLSAPRGAWRRVWTSFPGSRSNPKSRCGRARSCWMRPSPSAATGPGQTISARSTNSTQRGRSAPMHYRTMRLSTR